MPSKKIVEKPSFFRKQLEDGAKTFRYRAGVRSLLGFAESAETLRFAQPLPPIDLHSLKPLIPDTPWKTEDTTQKNKTPPFPAIPAQQNLNKLDPQNERNDTDPHPEFTETQLQSETILKRAVSLKRENLSWTEDEPQDIRHPQNPDLSDKKTGHNTALPLHFTEKMQVDIPGFSKKPSSFPALASTNKHKEQTEDEDKTPLQKKVTEGPNKAQNPRTLPLTSVPAEKETRPDFKTIEKFEPDQNGRKHKSVSNKRGDKQTQAMSRNAMAQNKVVSETTLEHFLPLQADLHKKTSDNAVIFSSLSPEKQSPAWPYLEHRSKKETQIFEQKAQTETINKSPEIRETQTAPIVIVKHAPPQSKTPLAFWERRYLNHAALKLRILR